METENDSRELMGLETEFGFSTAGGENDREDRATALIKLLSLMRVRYPSLNGTGSRDVFAVPGRFYGDIGEHPEHCTPECSNPWDLVRYTLAGRQVMSDMMQQLRFHGIEATIFTSNVDYQTCATWGCHESYLYRYDPQRVFSKIVPHLVSRIIYTGAGGFNSNSSGLEFMISPRVAHLTKTISAESTTDRGILHTKDQPMTRGSFHRLHLLLGESLSSQKSAWLRAGTTSLVLAAIDNGLDPEIELKTPLSAMNTFARDTSLTRTVLLSDYRQMTALQIQRACQQWIADNVDAPFMPPWAPEVCRQWDAMLTDLETGGADAVAAKVDWGIKWALYNDLARRKVNTDLAGVQDWNFILHRLRRALRDTSQRPISVESVLESDSPAAPEVRRLSSFLKTRGLSWDNLRPVVDLRTDLHALDMRFGMLGDRGLFNQLDAEGLLDHGVAGVDNIDHAVRNPPNSGRARVRGECIRRLSDQGRRYVCGWSAIIDTGSTLKLDLSDPFVEGEHWVDRNEKDTFANQEEVA
jgi:proteasome accessory factor A